MQTNPSDLCRQIKHELNAIDHVTTEAKQGAENAPEVQF